MIKCKVQLSSDRYARGEMIFIIISNVGDDSVKVSKCMIESTEVSIEKYVNQLLRPGESTTVIWDQYRNGDPANPGEYRVTCVADSINCSSSFTIMP
ncbi:MAG: hypothetical protein ACP5NY_01010 [Thermocladium sp.]